MYFTNLFLQVEAYILPVIEIAPTTRLKTHTLWIQRPFNGRRYDDDYQCE